MTLSLNMAKAGRIKEIIHLHVQDPKIDHPEVFVTFCLDRDFVADRHAVGNENPLVLLLQLVLYKEDGSKREERIFIPDLMKSPGRFLPFGTPGKWEVSAYVVELPDQNRGQHSTFRTLRSRFLTRNSGNDWAYRLSLEHGPSDEYDFWRTTAQIQLFIGLYSDGGYRGFGDLEIVMPSDAFAPPPPKWLDAWVRAYTPRSKPVDECDFRRRFLISLFVQPIPYLLWEFVKRASSMVVGLWLIVFSGYVTHGAAILKRAFSPQLVFEVPESEFPTSSDRSTYHNWHPRFTPIKLVCYSLFAWLAWTIRDFFFAIANGIMDFFGSFKPATSAFDFGSFIAIVTISIGTVLAIFVLGSLALKHADKYLEQTRPARAAAERQRKEERARKENEAAKLDQEKRKAEADSIRSGDTKILAVCGPDGEPASQGKEVLRKSITLQMSAFKRKICREYA